MLNEQLRGMNRLLETLGVSMPDETRILEGFMVKVAMCSRRQQKRVNRGARAVSLTSILRASWSARVISMSHAVAID